MRLHRLWVTYGFPWHRTEAKIGTYSSPTCWRKAQVRIQPHPVCMYITTHCTLEVYIRMVRCPGFREYSRKDGILRQQKHLYPHFVQCTYITIALYPGHCRGVFSAPTMDWIRGSQLTGIIRALKKPTASGEEFEGLWIETVPFSWKQFDTMEYSQHWLMHSMCIQMMCIHSMFIYM